MDIQRVFHTTGIEKNRIRFIEMKFGKFFNEAGIDLQCRYFSEKHVRMIQFIHEQFFEERRKEAEVQREVRRRFLMGPVGLKTIAITSGKGGVGKTTVGLNLAIALARQGQRVLLFDADLGLANVHVLAGIQPRGTLLDVVENRMSIQDALIDGPAGIQVLCGGSGILKLAGLKRNGVERLGEELDELSSDFDVVLFDTGAGISEQVMYFLSISDEIVVIATPNIASTLDAYGLVKVAHQSRVSGNIRLLMNLVQDEREARMVCSRIQQCSDRFLSFQPGWLGYLLKDSDVERANQSRTPYVLCRPASFNTRQLGEMARCLHEEPGARDERAAAGERCRDEGRVINV